MIGATSLRNSCTVSGLLISLLFQNHLLMKLPNRMLVAAVVLVAVVAACSVLKKENSEKDIRVFLTTFQSSLGSSDDEILKFFETRQSKEAILSAVKVLQNKEHEFIECLASFDN